MYCSICRADRKRKQTALSKAKKIIPRTCKCGNTYIAKRNQQQCDTCVNEVNIEITKKHNKQCKHCSTIISYKRKLCVPCTLIDKLNITNLKGK